MRAVTLLLLALATLAACSSDPSDSAPSTGKPGGTIVGDGDEASDSDTKTGATKPGTSSADKVPAKSTLEVLQEQVYVIQKDYDGREWICTGTLVDESHVVTAAHCLDESMFESFTVIAPLAPGKPRVSASNPRVMNEDYDAVENPDFGFLTLDEPIELAAYGVLTDVSAQVESGKSLTATSVVRTKEENEAPFKAVDGLKLVSKTNDGYDHGYGVSLFSKGGDSGAGIFLVENGAASHKLVAICRQPDPDTNTDMLTRIDADVIAWFESEVGQ